MEIDQPTRSYYEDHALAVFDRTLQVTLSEDWYTPFRSQIPSGGHILDAGQAATVASFLRTATR